jgi:hypothetical protein
VFVTNWFEELKARVHAKRRAFFVWRRGALAPG